MRSINQNFKFEHPTLKQPADRLAVQMSSLDANIFQVAMCACIQQQSRRRSCLVWKLFTECFASESVELNPQVVS